MKCLLWMLLFLLLPGSVSAVPAISSNSVDAIRLMNSNQRRALTPMLPRASRQIIVTGESVEDECYKKAVDSKNSVFFPQEDDLRIVQLTEKGAVCRFKSEKKCIFIPAKGIKNFSTAVAGSRIACNAAKCKHSNLIYQPANKKMFGRAYLCNGYVCTRCKRHFMSKAEAQKEIIHGWKLYRRGRVNINNSLMPVFSLTKPSKK